MARRGATLCAGCCAFRMAFASPVPVTRWPATDMRTPVAIGGDPMENRLGARLLPTFQFS